MNTSETLREVENLRFRVQMNNRLRLECLAAVSKVFREFEEPINDELLSSMIFALPQELISGNGNGHRKAADRNAVQLKENPQEEPQKPALPPEPELPPQEPEEPEPAKEAPALPPTSPDVQAPALPPQSAE